MGLLIVLEILSRVVLYPASKDFVRFREYPARAEALAALAGQRVVLLGNSTTEEGVDVPTVTADLQSRGLGQVHLDMFVADGSEITSWRYMLERYFWKPGLRPDLVVITFFGPLLSDRSEKDLGRLAQFFTSPPDWPDLYRTDLSDLSLRVEFALSAAWATYAARERIKARLLASVVPDYKNFEVLLASEAARHARRRAVSAAPATDDYRALHRLLQRARESATTILFVAFPMYGAGPVPPYQLDPRAAGIIHEAGGDLVDLRSVPELTAGDYRDLVHLNERGRPKYSRRLAEVLAVRLRVATR